MIRPSTTGPVLGCPPRGRSGLPVWGGAVAVLLAATVVALLPEGWLELLLGPDGLPLVHAPRLLPAIVAGVLTGAAAWSSLYLLVGRGGPFHRPPVEAERTPRPVVRRADAHPDAPPRPPMTAAELGVPPPPERDLPTDLDQPLAAFDPAAIPDVPREPVRPVAPTAAAPFSPRPA